MPESTNHGSDSSISATSKPSSSGCMFYFLGEHRDAITAPLFMHTPLPLTCGDTHKRTSTHTHTGARQALLHTAHTRITPRVWPLADLSLNGAVRVSNTLTHTLAAHVKTHTHAWTHTHVSIHTSSMYTSAKRSVY